MRDRKFTPNDNGSVIRMLSGRYVKRNRGRNRILLGAVILGIVTLTMVFGISFGRIRAEALRAAREAGTAASGQIEKADRSQYAAVRSLGYISQAGRSVTVGEAEAVKAQHEEKRAEEERSEGKRSEEETSEEAVPSVCLIRWMDGDAWEGLTVPAYTDIHGTYPENAQEIMLSLKALEKLGIREPQEGMKISLKISVGIFRSETEEFELCGWFTEYADESEGLTPGYISRAKLEEWGFAVDSETDILFRQTDGMDWRETEERLYEDIQMKDASQNISVSDTYAHGAVNELTGGYEMAAIGALAVLSGMFFLIHNVMQISIAGDIRQMGLLNVIGTTERQIRKIYYGQILRVLLPGVLIGGGLSGILLLLVIPEMLGDQYLSRYGGAGSLQIFHPGILAASTAFAVILVFAASAGVIRRAAGESCAGTVQYTGLRRQRKGRRKETQEKGKGASVQKERPKRISERRYRRRSAGMEILFMAWQNLVRYRRRFILTVLSLFLGAEAFLGVAVITAGSDHSHVIERRPDFLIAGQFGETGQELGYGNEYRSRDAGEDPLITQGDPLFLLYDNDYDEFSPISAEVREELLNLEGVDREDSYVMEGAFMVPAFSRKAIRPLAESAETAIREDEVREGSVSFNYSEGTEWIEDFGPAVIQIISEKEISELKKYVEQSGLLADMDSVENGTGVLILHDHILSREQEKWAEESVGEPVYFTSLLSKEDLETWNRMSEEEQRESEGSFSGKRSETFTLGGYLDNQGEGFPEIRQTWHGAESNVYFLISETGFEKLPTGKKTLYMELEVEEEMEPRIKNQIREIIAEENRNREDMTGASIDGDNGEAGIFCISKSDLMAEAADQIRGSRLILGSISAVLLCAGITNYLNVMITGILSRRRELAVMESIGMTGRQKRRMLMAEGGFYCLITAALILTAGSGLLALIRGYMEARLSYFVWQYPFGWTMLLLAGMAGICLMVPVAMVHRESESASKRRPHAHLF